MSFRVDSLADKNPDSKDVAVGRALASHHVARVRFLGTASLWVEFVVGSRP